MGRLKSFKFRGLWVADKYPYYIAGLRDHNTEYFRLFNDGSGSWRYAIAVQDLCRLRQKPLFGLKKALKKALKNGHVDNLTYIEFLSTIKENERIAKSKKSIQPKTR